ncbi:MAG: putative signal transducing protein [Crocinitomicaceae bacterium]
MDNKICVYTAKQEHEAILLRDQLSEAGIDAVILDQKDVLSGIVGQFEIHVDNEKVEAAKKIVEAFDHE